MSLPPSLRLLTPLGWLLVAAAGAGVILLAAAGAGMRWDPFGLDARRLARAERQAADATAEASARAGEAAGERLQQDRLILHHETVRAADVATAAASTAARTADDASIPLDPHRVDRLHAHDRELCRLAPDLVGCPAPPRPS